MSTLRLRSTASIKECPLSQSFLEMAKDLVLAQIQSHKLSPEEMHPVLQQTYTSLQALKMQEDSQSSVAVATPETPSKPVNWKKSITKHTVTCPGVWSQLQATVGSTSQGTWAGWEGVPDQVWHSTDTIVSRKRNHVTTEGDGAAVETVGEGSDVCEGAGEGAKGYRAENEQDAEEKDGESEGVGKESSLRMFYRYDLLRTRP